MNERAMTVTERERVLAKINEQAVRLKNAKRDELEINERIRDREHLARSTSSRGIKVIRSQTTCYRLVSHHPLYSNSAEPTWRQ
jgi:hypothetical protein